jgi:peptidoglycan/LPS O-acetylase OafA/YrhL
MPFKFLLDKIFRIDVIELLPILWAIRVEFLFYFIASTIVYFINKKPMNDKRISFYIMGLLGTSFLGNMIISDPRISSNIGYIMYFILGFLFYSHKKNKKKYNFLIFITLTSIFFHASYNPPINQRHFSFVFLEKLDTTALTRGLYVIVLITFIFSKTRNFMALKTQNYLGKISFFIYISHYPIIFIFLKYHLINNNYLFLYVLPITIAVSSISFGLYESLISNIKDKIRNQKSTNLLIL